MRHPVTTSGPAVRRDGGMTLIELLVTIGLLGLISAVVVGAVTVVFRSEAGVTNTIAESHDIQQAVNYFHLDVQSGPFEPADYKSTSAPNRGAGCGDAGNSNVFRYDDGDRRIAYELNVVGAVADLDRFECRRNGATWDQVSKLNIADALDASVVPIVEVDVLDTTADGEVDRVEMTFSQSRGSATVVASPRSETGVAAAATASCTDDPLSAALEFSGFVRNDVTLLGQDVLGTLAVGGTLAWTPALGVAPTDKNMGHNGVSLYAGNLDWSYAGSGAMTVNGGDVALGGTFHGFTSGTKKGRVYESSAATGKYIDVKKDLRSLASVGVIDFDAQFTELEACSNLLAELPGACSAADCASMVNPLASPCNSGTPYPGSGKMCLDIGPKGAQILNIPESELAEITEFSHQGGLSQAHPLIINIIDDVGDPTHVDFTLSTGSWQNIGNTKNVLVNFPTALTVTIDQPLYATVLAPYGHVTTIGNVHGGVIALAWTHQSGTVDNKGQNVFDGTIDWS